MEHSYQNFLTEVLWKYWMLQFDKICAVLGKCKLLHQGWDGKPWFTIFLRVQTQASIRLTKTALLNIMTAERHL